MPIPKATQVPLDIGHHKGLWQVLSHPPLINGSIRGTDKYPCLCMGCNKEYQVQHRYLVEGRSLGCRKCRGGFSTGATPKAIRKPCPENPVCINCGQLRVRMGKKYTRLDGRVTGQFYCKKCKTYKTVQIG